MSDPPHPAQENVISAIKHRQDCLAPPLPRPFNHPWIFRRKRGKRFSTTGSLLWLHCELGAPPHACFLIVSPLAIIFDFYRIRLRITRETERKRLAFHIDLNLICVVPRYCEELSLFYISRLDFV